MCRALALCLVLIAATPAAAQPAQFQLDDLRAREEAAQRRAVDLSNQLQALEARMRADQAIGDLARPAPAVPALRYPPKEPSVMPTPDYPRMPDAALVESNRRVQAAARTPR
jgi:hypothetical protein